MKKHCISACLCSALMLCVNMQNLSGAAEDSGLQIGHFQSYRQYETASSAGRLIAANESLAPAVTEELPSRFDLRSLGLVSSVKDQKNYGMCWSFSAMNSIENHLIARWPQIDLSEWHLAYYAYSQKFGFPLRANTDMDDVFQQGGNYYIMAPMLTSWTGPVSESVFPFDDYDVLNPDAEWNEVRAQAEYHVSDAENFVYHVEETGFPDQLEAVKQAVWQGNALSMSYYNKGSCYRSENYAYYNANNELTGGNYHAVSIVGWDDAFPAENFGTEPPADGAWLVKNSWGADWGDNGYFWMSYYDPTMLEFYYLNTEPFDKHDAMYQYDDYGYWMAFSIEDFDESAYIANVFSVEEDTYLTSVMLCTAVPDEQYSIRIYTNPTRSTNPASGVASAYTVGSFSSAGYHTVDLTDEIELHQGDTFSIVVKYSGAPGQHITCEASTRSKVTAPSGAVTSEASMLTEAMICSDFHQGESFYSANGKKWYDFYEEEPLSDTYTAEDGSEFETYAMLGNACLRGLCKKAGTVIFSEDAEALPSGTEIVLSSPGSSEIRYSINGGEELLYTDPILMPEEDISITAYAVRNHEEQPLCQKEYRVQTAQISSLLASRTGQPADYLTFHQTEEYHYRTYCRKLEKNETLSLMPIAAGTVTAGEEILPSGILTELHPEDSEMLQIRSSQPGMTDAVYEICFTSGDVNLDGAVNAEDAAAVLAYAAAAGSGTHPELPDDDWLLRADYRTDQLVNADDASGILVYAAAHGAGM